MVWWNFDELFIESNGEASLWNFMGTACGWIDVQDVELIYVVYHLYNFYFKRRSSRCSRIQPLLTKNFHVRF